MGLNRGRNFAAPGTGCKDSIGMSKRHLRVLGWIAGATLIVCAGLVVVAGRLIGLPIMSFPTPSHIILENHGTEPIREANIEILGKGYLLRGIEPEHNATLDFTFKGSGGYRISLMFRSGRPLTVDTFAPLDSSAEITDTLFVTNDGIRIATRCVKKNSSDPVCTHPEVR